MKKNAASRSLVFSGSVWIAYVIGIFVLSHVRGMGWNIVPVFGPNAAALPWWGELFPAFVVLSGTLLIYLVPGIFIAGRGFRGVADPIELVLKGFLLNYAFYYLSSTAYKVLFHREFSRDLFMVCSGIGILLLGWMASRKSREPQEKVKNPGPWRTTIATYVFFLTTVFFVFREKIFFSLFNGDGAEQFWLADSLRAGILPTAYRSLLTAMPQFPFAPSLYLNTFALILFGPSEFALRIQPLLAYAGVGIVLWKLIGEMRGREISGVAENVIFFLYLFLFFIVIVCCAGYAPPADLAKSNEVLQLAFFLSGIYLLVRRERPNEVLAALSFLLAAMIRYNGSIIISLFLAAHAIAFKRWRCLAAYGIGWLFALVLLKVFLLSSPVQCKDLLAEYLADAKTVANQAFSLTFMLSYLRNYFILTAGLSVFLFGSLKNRCGAIMLLISMIYLLLPVRAIYVPAHYFMPIMMFPLIGFFLWKNVSRRMLWWVVLLELLTIFHVFPKTGQKSGNSFRYVWAHICANTPDLFEADRRFRRIRPSLWGIDDRVSMYYADLIPKPGKKYLMYLGTMPALQARYYGPVTEQGETVYLPRGVNWNRWIRAFPRLKEDYAGPDRLWMARRD